MVQDAFAPMKATPQAAGFDLRSIEDYVIPPKSIQIVRTGLKIELPAGCYGRIAPRSGLAVKYFIDVGGNIINIKVNNIIYKLFFPSAGVIDSDYTGEVKIVLFHHSQKDVEIKKGDRVAQLICERILEPQLQEVEV